MRVLVPILVLLALVAPGCVSPLVPVLGSPDPSHWEFDVEPSMSPDFSGENGTYPILLVHDHSVASQRDQDYAREHPVVCLDLQRAAIETPPARERSAMAEATCAGPTADPAIGRVFAARGALDEAHADALAIRMGACSGGIVFLGPSMRSFIVAEPRHDFVVQLFENRSFAVDGRWIPPGFALKIGYYLHYGSGYDQAYVRVAFDHPGEWRKDRIAPYGDALDGGVRPHPDHGSGLVVDVPLSPASLRAPLEAAVNATPGRVSGVGSLRIVHDGTRLTEATIQLATDQGVVTWYGAGRSGATMRLLGALDPPRPAPAPAPAADPAALARAFDVPWATLRAGSTGLVDVRLLANVSWTTAPGRALAAPLPDAAPCDDPCVMTLVQDTTGARTWERVLLPQETAARDALTLKVVSWPDAGGHARWWTAPRA